MSYPGTAMDGPCQPCGISTTSPGRPRRDLEVVDLLELGLPRPFLVVLVRRVRRPGAGRGERLAGDQAVGLEGTGRAEVVRLPGAGAGAAQLDGDVRGGPVA